MKMRLFLRVVVLLVMFGCSELTSPASNPYAPTVTIAVLVRNKAHSLPYFLSSLMNLTYPKEKIHLWLYTDYNEDRSVEILKEWTERHIGEYAALKVQKGENGPMPEFEGEEDSTEASVYWSDYRMKHVIELRENALKYAREHTEYIFMLDADVYLTNTSTLDYLVSMQEVVVAPMLVSEGLYSNFWAGMTDNYYYKRTDDYKPILHREKIGCFSVPMVHSAVLVNLKNPVTSQFTYDPDKLQGYQGPIDDIITFAVSVAWTGVKLKICNEELFGFVQLPVADKEWETAEHVALSHIILEALAKNSPLTLADELVSYAPPPPLADPLPVAKVYLINLLRRADRRARMFASLKQLRIEAQLVDAVDGLDIDMNNLQKLNVTLMPGYEDPYHKRPMKKGEVGCFLSHYRVWEDMVSANVPEALVLEDDVRFEPHFQMRLHNVLEEVRNLDWDLLYIGRKILSDEEEYVTEHIVKPRYTYWTLAYVLRQRGARRLLEARPLSRLLPVDEFLPIMFNQHPNKTWTSHYPKRDLVALSAAPLLVTPTHYTGQPGYVSDTEDSPLLATEDKPVLLHDDL